MPRRQALGNISVPCITSGDVQVRARFKQEYEEELADFFNKKRAAESQWRGERQGQLAEMMALKQQCATNEKVCMP